MVNKKKITNMNKTKVFILSNDDLTSNIIFSSLFGQKEIEVVGIGFTTTIVSKKESKLLGPFVVLKKTFLNYWLFLVITNGLFKVFECLKPNAKLGSWLVSVKNIAKRKNIPIYYSANFNSSEFLEILSKSNVDILAIRMNQILNEKVLNTPKLGTICSHSSLLPSYKGIAGEFNAMAQGEHLIGSSIFNVELVLDEGHVLFQRTFKTIPNKNLLYHLLKNNIIAKHLLRKAVIEIGRAQDISRFCVENDYESSYFSWPSKRAYGLYKKRGYKLLTFTDLMYLIRKCLLF